MEATRPVLIATPSTIPLPPVTSSPKVPLAGPIPGIPPATITIESPAAGSTERGGFELRLETDVSEPERSRLEVRIDALVVYEGPYRDSLSVAALPRGRHEVEVRIAAGDDHRHATAEARAVIFIQQPSRRLPHR